MAQTLTDIRATLAAYGLRPKHRLGQNFLHDQNQLDRIVSAAEIAQGQAVLEVGPGTGTLTQRLLKAGARVLAVEVDERLMPILCDRLVGYGDQVEVVHGDILAGKHALNAEVMERVGKMIGGDEHGSPSPSKRSDETPPPLSPMAGCFKLIANLPYHVASPLLVNLVVDHPEMEMAVVMVQREVAERLCAKAGAGRAYGPVGIIVQSMCEVQRLFTLGPGCFWPQPKVESAVVRIRRRERPLTDDPAGFARAVHRLFHTRRKQLGSVIGRNHRLPAGIEAGMRAEELTVQQLVALAGVMGPCAEGG